MSSRFRSLSIVPFVAALVLCAPPGRANTGWNPADADAAITLSTTNFSNDTPAQSSVSNVWRSVRSVNTPPHTSGKYHVEFKIKAQDGNGGWIAGGADSTQSLSTFCGASADSFSVQANPAVPGLSLYYNSTNINYVMGGAPAVNDIIAIEIDIGNKLFWAQDVTAATGWTDGSGGFAGNSGAGTGGTGFASLTTTGGVMLCFSGKDNISTDSTVLFTTTGSFTGTVSSGFSPWDGGGGGGGGGAALRTLLGVGQ